jgi:hypothetical protein
VRRVAFTSAKSYSGSHVQLFRLDQQQLASKETGLGGRRRRERGRGLRRLYGRPLRDRRAGRRAAASEIAAVTVRGAATGGRLGIVDPDDPGSLAFFWPTPDQTGTHVDAGAAFGKRCRPTSQASPAIRRRRPGS